VRALEVGVRRQVVYRHLTVAMASSVFAACGDATPSCRTTSECKLGFACVANRCVLRETPPPGAGGASGLGGQGGGGGTYSGGSGGGFGLGGEGGVGGAPAMGGGPGAGGMPATGGSSGSSDAGMPSIAFLAAQTDGPDSFAFVTFDPIPVGTVLSFTDNRWSGSSLLTLESTVTLTLLEAVAAGTVIVVSDLGQANATVVGAMVSVSGTLNGLSTSGDQILAYVGLPSAPTFLAAISVAVNGGFSTTSTSASHCALPEPLVLGVNAVDPPWLLGGGLDNARYIGPRMGTRVALQTAVTTASNWEESDAPFVAPLVALTPFVMLR
jgi:hypothetical protein